MKFVRRLYRATGAFASGSSVAILAALLAAMATAPRAEAQITKEITSPIGPGGADLVVGSIVFPALSGSSSAGVLLELSAVAQQSYGTADIIEVSGSLAPASTAFRSLDLVASPEPICSPATAPCTNDGTLRLFIGLSNVFYRESPSGCGSEMCTKSSLQLLVDLGPLDVDSDAVLTGGEGVADDNCPRDANTDQADDDADGIGNVCEPDSDHDDIIDDDDNCLSDPNADQADADADGIGDVCELDSDDDGIIDDDDNCPAVENADQADLDGDALGDACDPDDDGDSIDDTADNCPFDANTDRVDRDGDGIGDICDAETIVDLDNDGVLDNVDACLPTAAGEVVNAGGCSIADLCPCDNDWKNRGAYVSCTVRTATRFQRAGLISRAERRSIVAEAARSQCGTQPKPRKHGKKQKKHGRR